MGLGELGLGEMGQNHETYKRHLKTHLVYLTASNPISTRLVTAGTSDSALLTLCALEKPNIFVCSKIHANKISLGTGKWGY